MEEGRVRIEVEVVEGRDVKTELMLEKALVERVGKGGDIRGGLDERNGAEVKAGVKPEEWRGEEGEAGEDDV